MSVKRARELVEKLKALDRKGAVFTIEQMEPLLARQEDILEIVECAHLALLNDDRVSVHHSLSIIAEMCGGKRFGKWKGIKSR